MEKIIVKASNKTQSSKKYALFIGRWQPWHEGHQWLVDNKLKKGENVCIAIRDVEVNEKNPWSAFEIQLRLTEIFALEISLGKVQIVIIPDIDSINIGRDVGYDIIEHVPSDEISQISATKIREQLKNK